MANNTVSTAQTSNVGTLTAKQRAKRIGLDYYRHRSIIDRWKVVLSWVAAGLTFPFVVVALLAGTTDHAGQRPVSRADVATVHSIWENKCGACHVPFSPISDESAWNAGWLSKVGFHANSHASDAKCNGCHQGDGLAGHHEIAIGVENKHRIESCAACHQDHNGRDADLTRMHDMHCTNCHANIGDFNLHRVANATKFGPTAEEHPEFQLPKEDLGKLKFNHSTHMRAGMSYKGASRDPFTYADIRDENDRSRYLLMTGAKDASAAVQLDCGACHQMDSADTGFVIEGGIPGKTSPASPSGPLQARGSTELMQPIVFEVHCRACHRLNFDARPEIPEIPHGLNVEDTKAFLFGVFASRQKINMADGKPVEDQPAAKPEAKPQDQPPARVFPGRQLRALESAREAEIQDLLTKQVAAATDVLFVRSDLDKAMKLAYPGKRLCGECHHFKDGAGTVPYADKPLPVVSPNIKMVWYPRAKFNHASHRAMKCDDCHKEARDLEGPSGVDTSKLVMIPKKDVCVRCHAAETVATIDGVKQHLGGARHDCAECHRFHVREIPEDDKNPFTSQGLLQSEGARARDPKRTLSIDELLTAHRDGPAGLNAKPAAKPAEKAAPPQAKAAP